MVITRSPNQKTRVRFQVRVPENKIPLYSARDTVCPTSHSSCYSSKPATTRLYLSRLDCACPSVTPRGWTYMTIAQGRPSTGSHKGGHCQHTRHAEHTPAESDARSPTDPTAITRGLSEAPYHEQCAATASHTTGIPHTHCYTKPTTHTLHNHLVHLNCGFGPPYLSVVSTPPMT